MPASRRAAPEGTNSQGIRILKKYPNRRLYDTERSKYVNLEELAAMIRDGADVRVVDAESGADLTREVLLQIVIEVLHGDELLPAGFLRRVIRASGDDPVQAMLRQQIGRTLEVLATQMDQLEGMFGGIPRPGKAKPGAKAGPKPAPGPRARATAPAADGGDDELDALRARLDALEKRLKRG